MRRTFAFRFLAYCTIILIVDPRVAFGARSQGIDVSDYQGNLTQANWNSIRADGKDFAWTKATEGGSYTASTFVNNMNRGTAAGVYMGAYHYARPDLNSATTDAAHFVAVAGPYLGSGYLRPMLDIEGSSFNLSTTDLSNWINTFCKYVTDRYGASADPLIYMSASRTVNEVNSSVTIHGLDVASYGSNAVDPPVPTGNPSTGVWPTWAFWQYGSQGRVAGIGGGTANVDLDVANGDINFVRQFLIGPPTPALFQQFDVNNTTAGSGVTAGGSYTWEAAKFSSSSAGIDPVAWNEGNSLRLAAGTDAAASNYTITANSNHTVAGMMLQANGGGTVTIDGPGVLSLPSGDQDFYVNASTQNLRIQATLGGSGKLVWQGSGSGSGNQSGGSLYLLGNNTYTGGTALNAGSGVNFNNDHSFGTGRITWGQTGGTATQYVLANDVATAPVTLANPVTTQAGSTLIYVGPAAAPVTFTGAWTLPSGTSTLSIGNASHTSSKMTISGAMAGSGGALTKSGVGTLVLSGANTYTGGTTITAGILQLGGGGTTGKLSTTGSIVNNSSLVFNRANAVTQGIDFTSSAISGAGTLTQAGSGTLTLSAANTYTGKTFINDGILSISSDANLGAAPGSAVADQLTFTGGTLQVTASFTMNTNRGITLTTPGGAISTTGGNMTLGGVMAGAGTLTKLGADTLTLTGANTYTGTTTITAGTLQLGSGNTTGRLSTASAIVDNATLIFNRSNTVTQGVDFSGSPISGTGSLMQSGSGNLILNAANSYGATTVHTGMLTVAGASARLGSGAVTVEGTTPGTALAIASGVGNAIDDNATLTLAGGGAPNVADQGYASLGAGVTEFVGSLILGSNTQPLGLTYGSSVSGAIVQSDEYFSGTGIVWVGLPGDFNGNGSVDNSDYIVWRKNPSTFGGNTGYNLWRSNFGATTHGSGSSLSQTAVPEPSAAFLTLICGLLVAATSRRQKNSRSPFESREL